MKRLFKTGLLLLLVAVVVGSVAWALLRPAETIYAGKPLHFWIKLLNDTSPGFDPPSPWETLGTNTVPVLIKALEHCDSSLPREYAHLHARTWRFIPRPILSRLPHPEDLETIGINAILLLEARRNESRVAIPAIIHIVRMDGNRTLKELPEVRRLAVSFLGLIGKGNQDVTQTLLDALKDDDRYVHYHAAVSLQRIDPDLAKKVLKPGDLEFPGTTFRPVVIPPPR